MEPKPTVEVAIRVYSTDGHAGLTAQPVEGGPSRALTLYGWSDGLVTWRFER